MKDLTKESRTDWTKNASQYGVLRMQICMLLAKEPTRNFTITDIVHALNLPDDTSSRSRVKQTLLRSERAYAFEVAKRWRGTYHWAGAPLT